MNISVELTLSPLTDDYESIIIRFIKKLRSSNLKVLENPLSTQVYGDYDTVMTVLKEEIKETFILMEHGVLFMKLVTTDRHDYEPDF